MYSDRLINAFKTALACVIGFAIIRFLNIPSSQWVIITILVVMSAQIHFGSALQKAYLRLLGTVTGALIAGVTLYFFKADNYLFINSIIIISAFLFSYFGGASQAMGQAMTLGSVTVPIILLSSNANLSMAYIRSGEIILGIFIAVLVNILIFPIHAKHKFEKVLFKNMKVLNEYYSATLAHDLKKCGIFEKVMMDSFALAQQLLNDAKREPGVKEHHYKTILLHQKRLFRAVSLLEYFSSVEIEGFISKELETLIKLALPAEFESAYPP
jgi:uncharacterized membrane protein YccC